MGIKFLLSILCLVHSGVFATRLLHLSFHEGCVNEVQGIAQELGIEVESWFIQRLPEYFFDGIEKGNVLYNITHQRAENVWKLHKDFFESFDGIITSDTAPLSRIFLQNNFSKPLIIWVCNRFDYYDGERPEGFPDAEYYQLMNEAKNRQNVAVVAYTPFEILYAKDRGVDLGSCCIKPYAAAFDVGQSPNKTWMTCVPESIDKSETFLIPPYGCNVPHMIDACRRLNIPVYNGRYNGPRDLVGFKGVIHMPCAWSNLALFEYFRAGLTVFIPTPRFWLELVRLHKNAWHTNMEYLLNRNAFSVSEWFSEEHAHLIEYFDSWDDLRRKTSRLDRGAHSCITLEWAEEHKKKMLARWRAVFTQIGLTCN